MLSPRHLLLLACFSAAPLHAHDELDSESRQRPLNQDLLLNEEGEGPIPKIMAGWYQDQDTDLDAGGTFSSREFRLRAPLYGTSIGDDLRIGVLAKYSYQQIETSSDAGLYDHDLHRLTLDMVTYYNRQDSPWFFWGRVAPGIAYDLDAELSDAVTGSLIASVGYKFSETFSFAAGAYAGESFGEFVVYPAVGFRWDVHEYLRLELVPPSLTLTWEPIDRAKIHLSAFPGGGGWAIETDDDRFDEIDYRNIRIGVGVDYELRTRLWASAWTGANLFQKLEYREDGHVRYESDLDDSVFFFLGLRYEIW